MSPALKRIFSQPAFLVTVIILAVGAVGLNAAVEALQLHFKKQPVPLPGGKDSLTQLPDQFGPWHQVSKDEPISHEIEDVLGTDQYVFRDYIDSRVVSAAVIDQFKDMSSTERKKLAAQIQAKYPNAVVNLAVTYYTGLVDTVAHIPDRCIIADGYEVKPDVVTDPKWNVGPESQPLEVRFLNFEDQAGRGRIDRSVAYFFHCNGDYTANPIGVRTRLQDLRQKYGYYAKVELQTLMKDSQASERVMTDFLSSALPEIEKLLPNWNQYSGAGVK